MFTSLSRMVLDGDGTNIDIIIDGESHVWDWRPGRDLYPWTHLPRSFNQKIIFFQIFFIYSIIPVYVVVVVPVNVWGSLSRDRAWTEICPLTWVVAMVGISGHGWAETPASLSWEWAETIYSKIVRVHILEPRWPFHFIIDHWLLKSKGYTRPRMQSCTIFQSLVSVNWLGDEHSWIFFLIYFISLLDHVLRS